MFEINPRDKIVARALLVGAHTVGESREDAENLLNELGELVRTLGVPIAEKQLVQIREPQARLFVGSGKAEELCERARELGCDVIIFARLGWPELFAASVTIGFASLKHPA